MKNTKGVPKFQVLHENKNIRHLTGEDEVVLRFFCYLEVNYRYEILTYTLTGDPVEKDWDFIEVLELINKSKPIYSLEKLSSNTVEIIASSELPIEETHVIIKFNISGEGHLEVLNNILEIHHYDRL